MLDYFIYYSEQIYVGMVDSEKYLNRSEPYKGPSVYIVESQEKIAGSQNTTQAN